MKQDLYHLALNTRFYLCFLAVMVVIAAATDMNVSFLTFYLMIFSATALLSLYSYDVANDWESYAAAVPGGRKAQVDGRYVLALLVWVMLTALVLALSLLPDSDGEKGGWQTAVVMGAIMLLYVDLVFPLNYRFGPRSRVVLIVIIGVAAGLMGVVMADGENFAVFSDPTAPTLLLLAAGFALMPASYAVSRVIVARREG